MDDLAKELGMSKKTIYQHFKDKRSLVEAVFLYDLDMDKKQCAMSYQTTDNAIQQFINILLFVNANLKGMNPSVIFDLKKYYPQCWKHFDAFTSDFIFTYITQNIEAGIEQGYYRPTLEPKVVGMIYITLVQAMVHSELEKNKHISLSKVHEHLMDYHIHAICTPKGLEYLTEHLSL